MNKRLFVVLLVVAGVVWGEVLSCTSCGFECQSACGTRHFRTCCFNYLKKRSSGPALPLAINPSLRLELWLAKSRSPLSSSFFPMANAYDYSSLETAKRADLSNNNINNNNNNNDNTNNAFSQSQEVLK